MATYLYNISDKTLSVSITGTPTSFTIALSSTNLTYTMLPNTNLFTTEVGSDTGTGEGTNVLTIPLSNITGSLSLTSGPTSTTNFTIGGNYTITTDRFIVDIGLGTVTFGTNVKVNANELLQVVTHRNILMSGTAELSADNNANILMSANMQNPRTTGDFDGILVSANAKIIGSVFGSTTIFGTGGNSTGNCGVNVTGTSSIITSIGADVTVEGYGGTGTTGTNYYGVAVQSGGTISSGQNGIVSVTGFGGALTTGAGCNGVNVVASRIISAGGDVNVTGRGGGGPSAGAVGTAIGVLVGATGLIKPGNAGNLTVTGIGGVNRGSNNTGVNLSATTATISSSGGNVTVIGRGGGQSESGATSKGVEITGTITAESLGIVNVEGHGGFGANSSGVNMVNAAARISSSGGDIQVDGIGGITADATVPGILMASGEINATGAGNMLINGAAWSYISTGTTMQTTSKITSVSGNISVTGHSTGAEGILQSATSQISSASGNISVLGSSYKPNSTADMLLSTGQSLTLETQLDIHISGTTVNTQYTQLSLNDGIINLNGVKLNIIFGSYWPTPGNQFTIVNNVSGTITGEFEDMPHDTVVEVNERLFKLLYNSNSIVLEATPFPPNHEPEPTSTPLTVFRIANFGWKNCDWSSWNNCLTIWHSNSDTIN